MKKLTLLFALALVLPLASQAQGIKVSAPNLVALDEQFKLTFSVEGEGKPSDFQWNCSSDFQLVWGPQKGYSSSTSIINGKVTSSSTTSYTYILMAKTPGRFTLPGATAKFNKESISSAPFTIEVVSGGQSSGSQSSGSQSSGSQSSGSRPSGSSSTSGATSDDIYMRLHLSSTRVVVGQPVIATVKLYQRVDVAGFDDARFPSFNGFWSQDITPQGDISFVREKVGDAIWNTAVLRKYVIIPLASGDLTIDPAELVCRIYVKVSPRGHSIFDGFFDDYTTVNRRVTTPAVKVHVSPLPSGAPASFGGGVGEFKLRARLDRDSLATHEAGSLVVTVSGKGNISLLEAPKVNFPPDFEVYDVKAKESIDKAGGSISGSKSYEYPFIPRSGGDFTIDPVKYSYYDVAKGRYVTAETDSLHLHVARGNESDAPVSSAGVVVPGVTKRGVKNLSEDIRFIKTGLPALSAKGEFFAGSALFWILASLLVVLAATVWALLRKVAARRADIAGNRNRKAARMALKRLKLSESFLRQNLYTAFYEELHKALLNFVSDKLNLPAGELSREHMTEELARGGVTEGAIAAFMEVLDACEFARYAPDAGHDAMEAHYRKALDAISSIDSGMKKKTAGKGATAVVATLLMLLPAFGVADAAEYTDSLWNEGVRAYTEGTWDLAVSAWTAIEAAGVESPELYTNIGDAWYKSQSYAKAILYYERALKLDPSDADARHNLEVARSFVQDDIEPVPEFVLKTWWRKFCYCTGSTVWAVLSLVFLAFALALLLTFLLGGTPGLKKTGFFCSIAALLMSLAALNFSLVQKHSYFLRDEAIVMRPVVPVKSSPSQDSASDLFILHEGTKVKVLDNVAGWTNIQLADGRQGWLRSDYAEII